MAEGGGGNDAKTNGDNPVIKSQMEVNECLGSWLTYLQVRNYCYAYCYCNYNE